VASYRISKAAKADLERIYRHGVREYGEAQADRYFDAFFERFDQLAARPYAYPAVNDIRLGYRRSMCGVDGVYYRVVDGIVEIMCILGRQDVDGWL
jgi:toxin ParE1/3/4